MFAHYSFASLCVVAGSTITTRITTDIAAADDDVSVVVVVVIVLLLLLLLFVVFLYLFHSYVFKYNVYYLRVCTFASFPQFNCIYQSFKLNTS